ncbi:kinesin-like protein KIF9 isoform X1 [Mytilus californianus]|uniref:kinesin-like protein KIF9 isoform X1 n=2 Tax=Mytilus californianus TaxID=6549 RepID=UPI002245E63C|nr:kinesin-like protein KIF9 isoform X1 [Mytilus californianus]
MYSRGNSGLSTYSKPEKKPSKNQRVKVWCRVRPTAYFDTEHLELVPDGKSVNVHQKKESAKGVVNNQILDWSFRLDGIFHNASQDHVFDTVASDIVTSALDGYNGTMMCYGQTGAGKTFTITGATESYKQRGILPRSISQLFREIEERPEYSITVRVSYLEIYNESMVDLLATLPEAINQENGGTMSVAENQYGVYVKGLSCHLTQNEEEALNYLFEGETNRAIAAHSLNAQSSRSHCIFTLYIETRSRVQSNARYTVSKLNFVDLAGSERLSKTKSDGKTQQEAMYINKSLTFLEQVIVALADRRREHIPFRQSKLTHCLKDSIGGNCNTLLIANIWGEKQQLEESVSTLRFATRMMCVASEPSMNEIIDPVVQCKRLEKEIQHLKHELAMHDTLTNRSHITYDTLSEQQRYEIRQQVRRYLEGHLDEIDIINLRQVQGVFDSFKDIYVQMEKDVEERLRQKFTLIDRTDPAAIAAAQQSGLPVTDDGLLVGETDGVGFGVGMAPKSAKADPSSVVQLKRKEKEKETKRGKLSRQDTKSPTGGKSVSSPSHSAKGEREVKSPHPSVDRTREEDAATPASSLGGPKTDRTARASTPPSRTTAFDIFKSEKGTELNRILVENKDILASNKKTYTDLARGINHNKIEIDQCRMKLEKLKEERESNGTQYNEEGDIIISEEEFLEVKRLKELKSKYKTDYDNLKNLKAKVQYCQRLVDNCRQKLIQEFDKWYSESFLSQTEDGTTTTSMAAGHGIRPGVLPPFNPNTVPEDEQEKFDRLQMELLMNNPDSAAFFNAQHRTQRRKTYEAAMMQPQPSYRRSPGTPTISIRNRPPNMLQISQ